MRHLWDCAIRRRARAELAARIPSDFKFNHGSGKIHFQEGHQQLFPDGLLDRPNQGLAVPLAEWFREELREWAHDILFQEDGFLDLKYLRLVWEQHQRKAQDHSVVLWGAFMFRHWQRPFLEPRTAEAESKEPVAQR